MNDVDEHTQLVHLMMLGAAGAPRLDNAMICGVCGNTSGSDDRDLIRLSKADDSVPGDFFNNVFLTWVAHVSCLRAIAGSWTGQLEQARQGCAAARLVPMARLTPVKNVEGMECPICYDDDVGMVFVKSVCNHVAHEECWRRWFSTGARPNCMVCRALL